MARPGLPDPLRREVTAGATAFAEEPATAFAEELALSPQALQHPLWRSAPQASGSLL